MAGIKFDIQGRQSAEAWKKRAQELNDKAAQIIREATEILNEFRETAEGQIFDQVVGYSNSVIQAVNNVLKGMNQLLEVVNDLIQSAMGVIDELVSGVKSTETKVIG